MGPKQDTNFTRVWHSSPQSAYLSLGLRLLDGTRRRSTYLGRRGGTPGFTGSLDDAMRQLSGPKN